jgi:NAD(P)-dependent dehydrogenase (short-subunit alcohol dehydrogenase family)
MLDRKIIYFLSSTHIWLQVGVYGYAAYSASKFALRGLAEVLQQELISRNIRLSLVYPPDTDTPGFAEGQFSFAIFMKRELQV